MDFYIILGLERGATLGEIKRAYRRLARRYHPDINPGDRTAAAQFRQIAEAYETLSDPDRRRRYDTPAPATRRPSRRHVRLRGLRLLGQRQRRVGARPSATCSPTCCSQRERGARTGAPERGADLHHDARRSASRRRCAAAQRAVTVTRQEHCRTCRGAGRLHAAETRVPARATARGAVQVGARPHGVLEAVRALRRHRAAAADALPDVRRAAGRDADASRSRSASRRASPTARASACRARATPAAAAARPATSTSRCTSQPHPLFRREGDDLHLVVPVAIHEAALGAKIDVPSLDGPARLRDAARHAVGAAVPAARARRAVAARRPARRSRRRGAARAAEAARRAVEGTAAGVRPDQRRGRATRTLTRS